MLPDSTCRVDGAECSQALPLADTVEVTEIDADFDGDVHAPALGPQWRETSRQPHRSAGGLPFSFVTYRRAGAA